RIRSFSDSRMRRMHPRRSKRRTTAASDHSRPGQKLNHSSSWQRKALRRACGIHTPQRRRHGYRMHNSLLTSLHTQASARMVKLTVFSEGCEAEGSNGVFLTCLLPFSLKYLVK